ncbi:MAG: phosphatidylinositol-specific phospholipase C1-like protein, partial [Planctomycetota bacterium]
MVRQALLLATLVVVETNMAAEPAKSVDVRLHQLQVIGTHNSYHIAPSKPVMAAIAAMDDGLAKSLDYTHRPLSEQFSRLGIRQIELDVFADPQGGLYAEPAARRMTKQTNDAWDPNGVMKQPGMKVLHVQDIDFRSTVPTLVDALQEIRAWSTAHPQSCPIMVMIELKQSSIGPEFTQPLPFDREQLDALDEEIQSVFAGEEIILPDDVRGRRETLREAVLNDGWPKLDDVRGKVMFAMDNGGDLAAAYLADHPSLRGRVLFVSVPESEPAAAFMKRNNPVADFEAIQRLVKQGFLVRTRADAGTRQSRQNDGSQRERAFASGAHFISTDYPEPDQRFSDYRVRFPHGVVARKNPVSGLSPDDREFDLADDGRIQLIAHRGGVVDQDRIENNLPAIEEAILRG